MKKRFQFGVLLFLFIWVGALSSSAQASSDVETPTHRAWRMLQTASTSKKTSDRSDSIRALGLLQDDAKGRQMAEDALNDPKPEVRIAAATALGKMHARESIPQLQHALLDKKIPVVMAVAYSLRELNDNDSAYAVYYDLLTGERKSSDGVIAEQVETLKNPKEMAKIGFSEGIGYVPFAGIGWDAWRTLRKKDPNPARGVAATFLAHDPDPATAKALVNATYDKNWIVRAAAVEALAQRGDRSLLPHVEVLFFDRNSKVRYSAAAAVIRLTSPAPPQVSHVALDSHGDQTNRTLP
jgi:HEAT repeat protein